MPCNAPLSVELSSTTLASSRIASEYCLSLKYTKAGTFNSDLNSFRVDYQNLNLSYQKRLNQISFDPLQRIITEATTTKADVSSDLTKLTNLNNQCSATSGECDPSDCEPVDIISYTPQETFVPGTVVNARVQALPQKSDINPKHEAVLQYLPPYFRSGYLLARADVDMTSATTVGNSTHCTIDFKVPTNAEAQSRLCSDYFILYS